MNDYISREAAIGFSDRVIERDDSNTNPVVVSFIAYRAFLRELPAADVEEVRHGTWEPFTVHSFFPDGRPFTHHKCSLCGRRLLGYSNPQDAPYCHCGAKMDGGAK